MYYKVVRPLKSGALASAVARNRFLRRIYSTEKWTHAPKCAMKKGYGILVFVDRGTAESFRCEGLAQEIWEAEVDGKMTLPPGRLETSIVQRFQKALSLENLLGLNWREDSWPDGTAMFRSVKLIRRVS